MDNSDKKKDKVLASLWESLEHLPYSECRELAERVLCPRQKSDMELMMELQRKYDELQADCKDLLSVIANLSRGKEEPVMVAFNEPDGHLSVCLDLIREHATWHKEPINKD